MELGLFGKLPAKRDFISYGVERAFLEVWEPWVQGAISASREMMRDGWLPAYMNAPIWRFWLGSGICGETVAGAVMPSVDGVGRYFPLSLIATGVDMAPPAVDAQEGWFDAAENLLLDALDEGRPFETTLAALSGLPAPGTPEPRTVEAAFAAIRQAAEGEMTSGLSFWWVRPVRDMPVRAMIRRGMPGPYDYVEMIRPVEVPPGFEPEPEEEPLSLTGAEEEAMPLTGGQAPAQGIWEVGDDAAAAEPPPEPYPEAEEEQPLSLKPADEAAPEADETAEETGAPEGDDDKPAEENGDKPDDKTGDKDGDALVLGRTMAVKADV